MISALRETDSPYDAEINHEAEAFARGALGVFYIPLAGWWSARIAATQPELAQRIFERALERCAAPMEPQCLLPLVGLAIAAKRMGRPTLEYFVAHTPWVDQAPVNQAQRALALAIVHDALGDRNAQEYDQAIRACESLDLRLYALIGRNSASPQDLVAAGELAKLGIHSSLPALKENRDERNVQRLTARERHVASIVAEGLTNRDIAERLVLSERTIEAHVANIFNKLNVSSRTQVAAWYLRSTVAG
jgi:DNA-binding CsgD family transcriptional regulator